jgi:DNA-binding NtrC family response regulator
MEFGIRAQEALILMLSVSRCVMAERKILCVSFDRLVSDSRYAALKEAGYSVTATIKIEEAMDLLGAEKFGSVVLGHRFSKASKQAVAALAQQAKIPVVLVCGAGADVEIPADARVYALQGPEGIVSAVNKLLVAQSAA